MKPVLKLGLAVLAIATLGSLLFTLLMRGGSLRPLPALPVPNGYDDFFKAGELVSDQPTDAREMSFEQLQTFITTNAESLRLLALGLTRTCSVHTVEFLTNNPSLISDQMAIKRLAQFGLGVGRLAELEGRTNEAITTYLAGIRYGNEASRGGFIIHRLVGIACENMARSQLARLITNLNPTEVQGIIPALEKIDTETVSWNEIQANERMYMRQYTRQFQNPILLVQSWWAARSVLKGTSAKHLKEIAQRRLLLVELALRCHVSAHGNPPRQLSDLVPEYLARVPLDPFTERALDYRPQGTNWLLQSRLR